MALTEKLEFCSLTHGKFYRHMTNLEILCSKIMADVGVLSSKAWQILKNVNIGHMTNIET